ncbi:hypothetical protein ACUUL3_01325 [Thiovibrio sp. JS02]
MKKLAIPMLLALTLCLAPAKAVEAKKLYKTYEVVEVTEKSIVLKSAAGETVEIEKERRPNLEKGDKVRYDKIRNRLGETLDK